MSSLTSSSSLNPIQLVLRLVSLEKQDILLLFCLTMAYGVLGIATPVAVQAMVNLVTMGGVLQPLYIVGVILFCLLGLSGALYAVESYLVEMIQRRMYVRSSVQIAENTQRIQISVYDRENPVELMNRYFDITTMQKSAASLLTVGLTAMLQGLIGSLVLLFYSPYFAILVIVMLLSVWAIVAGLGKQAETTAIKESKAKYQMAAWLENMARNLHLSKFFSARARVTLATSALVDDYLQARSKHFRYLILQLVGAVSMYALIGTGMLILGGTLVIQGQINLGQFVAAELIIFGVLSAFVRFVTKLEYWYDMLAAADKLSVLEYLPQEDGGDHGLSDSLNQLTVSALGFYYQPNLPVFSELQLHLQGGQSLAVLGPSGAGKSTLLELLCGLRQPQQGYIAYNGADLRQLDLEQVRSQTGMAGKVEWQYGSILDNLRLGRPDIELGDVVAILKGLGIWDDISRFDRGLDTELTDFGAPLSHTQLQRLMLARALIARPPLVMIDGLLDSLAQSELDAALRVLADYQPHCILIMTTRFAHIAKQCDAILHLSGNAAHRLEVLHG